MRPAPPYALHTITVEKSVKVFKSIGCETKFEDFAAAAFDAHKGALQKDLSMHARICIWRANQSLAVITSKVDMLAVFAELRSSEVQRELQIFTESKGGPGMSLQDDTLMDKLISRNEKATALGNMSSAKETKYDLRKDLEDNIKENLQVSENLLHALQVNVRFYMETTVRREGDRIIETLLASPQDRISAQVRLFAVYWPLIRALTPPWVQTIYEVWTEMVGA